MTHETETPIWEGRFRHLSGSGSLLDVPSRPSLSAMLAEFAELRIAGPKKPERNNAPRRKHRRTRLVGKALVDSMTLRHKALMQALEQANGEWLNAQALSEAVKAAKGKGMVGCAIGNLLREDVRAKAVERRQLGKKGLSEWRIAVKAGAKE